MIVPLLAQRDWAATNEILRGTPLENGYGAGRVLGWLVSGQLLDHGRLPVVTLFAAVGFVLAWRCRRRDANARALLVALAACLLLSFGRTTFGSLVDVDPRQRRHLLPPLHDGHPARGAAARRGRRRVVGPRGLECA